MLSDDAFAELFNTFRVSAFRLEQFPHYAEDDEADYFARFHLGKAMPADWETNPWVAGIVANGRTMTRVRVLDTPLTDYERFQVAWAYVGNAASGEDIRLLDRSSAGGLPAQDFWLFDDADVIRLHYDDRGAFVGAERLPDAETARYRSYRDTALARAVPYAAEKATEP